MDAGGFARDREGDRGESLARHRHGQHGRPRALRGRGREPRLRRRHAVLRGRAARRADGSGLDDPRRHARGPVPREGDTRAGLEAARAGGRRGRAGARALLAGAAARARDGAAGELRRQQRVGRRSALQRHRHPDDRERPAPRPRLAVDLLRVAPGIAQRSSRAAQRERRRLPGRAGCDPRPERARELGGDHESDGRGRRVPGRAARVRRVLRPLRAAHHRLHQVGRHFLPGRVQRLGPLQREQARRRHPRQSGARYGLASPHGAVPQLRACDRRRGPLGVRDRRRDDRARAPVHGFPRHRRGRDLPGLGPRPEPRRVPHRARELRLRLAELGLHRRRGEPRVFLERRAAAARRPRGRPDRPHARAGLRARRRLGPRELGAGRGAVAGPGDPVRGAARGRDAADRESAERLLRERQQRPGRHEPRQRRAEPAAPRQAGRDLLPLARLRRGAPRRPHHAPDQGEDPVGRADLRE